ncbi:MAG: hypothetical protein GY847_08525 [Proteobacteria bacterium]|nr:hypothetical protein [Pseudomonadota bacterium]
MRQISLRIAVFILLAACTEENRHAPAGSPALANSESVPARKTTVTAVPEPSSIDLADKQDISEKSPVKVLARIDGLLDRLRSASVSQARLISNRTLSLKLWLNNGDKAVFKPMRKHDRRAVREVAVCRLARLLDVETVPLSTMRTLPLGLLVRLIKKNHPDEAIALQKTARTDEKANVQGAIIQWINGLDPNGFKNLGGRSKLMGWLALKKPNKKEAPIAASASAMIVFDYITGNWDRFSGGNFFLSPSGQGLVLLDHNSTFASWSDRQQKRMEKLLTRTERFPADLIQRIGRLTAESIESAIAEEPWHARHRLISEEEVELILSRRDRLVAHVNHLIGLHGEESVLAFR